MMRYLAVRNLRLDLRWVERGFWLGGILEKSQRGKCRRHFVGSVSTRAVHTCLFFTRVELDQQLNAQECGPWS